MVNANAKSGMVYESSIAMYYLQVRGQFIDNHEDKFNCDEWCERKVDRYLDNSCKSNVSTRNI